MLFFIQMESDKRIIIVVSLTVLLLVVFSFQVGVVSADESGRTTTIIVPYTEYEWWLISWSNNDVVCRIYADHEGVPTTEEVFRDCGTKLGKLWQITPPCKISNEESTPTTDCKGLYLYLYSYQPQEKEVIVELPEPVVWVDLEGCTPTPPTNFCPKIPNLLLIGEEPLPNEDIVAIHGTYDGEPFVCPEQSCSLPLRATPLLGSVVEFWACLLYTSPSPRDRS